MTNSVQTKIHFVDGKFTSKVDLLTWVDPEFVRGAKLPPPPKKKM